MYYTNVMFNIYIYIFSTFTFILLAFIYCLIDSDEELLGEGLALNDSLQSLLAKHDAIASGSPLPIEAPVHRPIPKEPVKITTPAIKKFEDEADDDDGFAQLAQRSTKLILEYFWACFAHLNILQKCSLKDLLKEEQLAFLI